MAKKKNPELLDVAVVGGGVSGLYSAWRLQTDGDKPKIKVYEGSHRLGGRLLSATPPDMPQAHVEIGGMRFTSKHTYVESLVHLLGLSTEPFAVAEPQNICHVRGEMLRKQDLTNPDFIPYNLAPDELDPSALSEGFTAVAAERMLRAITGKNVDLATVDWEEVFATGTYEGKKLSDLAMRYVFLRSVSHEAFEFAMDTSGYNSIFHTWNAADGFPWNLADFGGGVSFSRVTDGYQQLPLKIAGRFEEAGGEICMEHRLLSFDTVSHEDGNEVMEMHFDDGSDKGLTVRARKLILAMPKRSLELIEQSGAVLDPDNEGVHELIQSVTPIPLFKLAICYSCAWWESIPPVKVETDSGPQLLSIQKGESVTDLPIRQCYYWDVDEENGNAVILIYDDGQNLEYWAGLRQSEVCFEGTATDGNTPGSKNWDENQAPQLMVEEIHRQLKIIHGVEDRTDIPEPYAAAYRDWGEDPYGGGANFWHLHVDSQQVSTDILQPKPGVPTYICGEAYSHFQGWVEGPLRTAEKMLQMHFGMQPPGWLKP